MAPLFTAFDRDTYERIIPNHLADIKQYPPVILKCLEKGGFTVAITNKQWHSVAFDEAHEMCINKDLKAAIIRPSEAYLQKTSLFFNYRIKAYKNLLQELFPTKSNETCSPSTITDSTLYAKHCEENIQSMCLLINTNKLFATQQSNRGLSNIFTGQLATLEQTNDMLSFRDIGKQAFKQYINTRILHKPSSTSAPLRRHKLMTMSYLKKNRRATPKEQEAKQVIKCLRRRLAWCNQSNVKYDASEEQYSILPRAIADEDGNPHKASKSNWTDKLHSRYRSTEPPVFTNMIPWLPQSVIIDAMFLINTKPLRRTTTILDYSKFLFNQFVLEHFKAGTKEVHLIFDNPTNHRFNPKQFEHARRYINKKCNTQHEHCEFTPNSNIPSGWKEHLECRVCKRAITEAIGISFLQKGKLLLINDQRLVVAGCFTGDSKNCAWVISPSEITPDSAAPQYNCNATEADNRIWCHASQTDATKILVISPDTDVYNIGLTFLSNEQKQYIVQLNVHYSAEKKYVSLNNLNEALINDPDLCSLHREGLCLILQSLFISTGCDFISYFKSFGKATILNVFFQYANFISGTNMEGSLEQTHMSNRETGFLAFIRLIGTCYFKRHLSAFISNKGHSTPVQLYNSIDPSLPAKERHQVWLQEIRKLVSNRITTEEERVPSVTSLWRHWLRSSWIHQMWQCSNQCDMYSSLPQPEDSGWTICEDGKYKIDWEAPEIVEKVKRTIQFLIKGCSCKKGCISNNCGCRKKGIHCGPGCECQGCVNLPTDEALSVDNNNNSSDTSENESGNESNVDSEEDAEELQMEIITDDFYADTIDIV